MGVGGISKSEVRRVCEDLDALIPPPTHFLIQLTPLSAAAPGSCRLFRDMKARWALENGGEQTDWIWVRNSESCRLHIHEYPT
jgi:hypothetical protein